MRLKLRGQDSLLFSENQVRDALRAFASIEYRVPTRREYRERVCGFAEWAARMAVDCDSPLVFQDGTPHAPAMESHEWFENTDEGKVYFRANYLGTRWTIMTTREKRNPTWTDLRPPPEAVWRELRDIVWKKYQRKRCPWERVAEIDKILGEQPPPR